MWAMFLAAAVTVALTGCVGVSINPTGRAVTGSGTIETKSFDTGSYTEVEVNGDFEVIYSSEDSGRITVEMQENLIQYVSVSSSGGRAVVNCSERLQQTNNDVPKLYVSTPDLKELVLNGAAIIEQADVIRGDSFRLNASGACELELELEVQEFDMNIAGAGAVTLRGSAERASIEMSGAGTFEALDLETVDAKVGISGAGTGQISCSNTLDVEISGMGGLEYRGDPDITKSVGGAGYVERIR